MEPEHLNPAATGVEAAHNLQMPPLNPTITTAAAIEGLQSFDSTTNSTAEAEAALSPSSVDSLGTTFPKKVRSRRHRFVRPPTTEEYLAHCLALLARSDCRGGSTSCAKTSNSLTSIPMIDNQKKRETSLEPQNRSFECTICNKSFTTYHALGGHKTSHKNKPSENNEVISASGARIQNVSPLNPSSNQAHVCSICHKSFNTGQALGGHKRMHYGQLIGNNNGDGDNGVFSDMRAQNMVEAKDLSIEMKPGTDVKFVHDFDLNLPAQSEPESQREEGLGVDSEEMKTEVDGDLEADQGNLLTRKRRLAIKLDLRLSLA